MLEGFNFCSFQFIGKFNSQNKKPVRKLLQPGHALLEGGVTIVVGILKLKPSQRVYAYQ